MGRIQRWTAGFFSQIDSAVTKIENHDGLVTVAIRDAQEARSRARVQLQRVRKDGARLNQQVTKLKEAETSWHERALRIGQTDETRALECLRRKKKAEEQRTELASQLIEHQKTEVRLGQDIGRIDDRVRELSRQRNLLRTRQSRAEALRLVNDGEVFSTGDLDDILDRWEIKVSTSEFQSDISLDDDDDLEIGFNSEEEAADLRCELQELLESETK
jgi:phage shock protein A